MQILTVEVAPRLHSSREAVEKQPHGSCIAVAQQVGGSGGKCGFVGFELGRSGVGRENMHVNTCITLLLLELERCESTPWRVHVSMHVALEDWGLP